MFTLYDNIKRLCDEKGVSPSKMCLDIGKTKSLMSSLRNGRTSGINSETAHLMADYFGVSVDEVLHGTKEKHLAKTDEVEISDDRRADLMAWVSSSPMEYINLMHFMLFANPETSVMQKLSGWAMSEQLPIEYRLFVAQSIYMYHNVAKVNGTLISPREVSVDKRGFRDRLVEARDEVLNGEYNEVQEL